MAISEDAVLEALKEVIDPELFVNVVDLGLIYAVDLKPAVERDESGQEIEAVEETAGPGDADLTGKMDVEIEMTMTSPACPAAPQLIAKSKIAVSQLENVGHVEIKIVMMPPWTPDRMTEDARDQLGIF